MKNLVVASGAYSKNLTDQLGEKIPLDTERGYHVHFKDMENLISRPVIFLDRGFGMTPMKQGLRAVGTVELGGLKKPPIKKRIDYIVKCAKELLPQLNNTMMNGWDLDQHYQIFYLYWTFIKEQKYNLCFWSSSFRLDFRSYNRQNYFWNSCWRKNKFGFISLQLKKDLIRSFLSKNYLAYLFLVLAALFWSGNFIVGKFATLFEIPPLTLNVFRWISVWFILIPFTYKEIYNNLPYKKKLACYQLHGSNYNKYF